MELLIDTNVILDIVLKRSDYEVALSVFQKIRNTNAVAYITASSATDLFYIIRKNTHDVSITYEIMERIFKLVSLLPITSTDILTAFSQKWTDFEDCVLYTTAKNNKIDYIITNNKKDFKNTIIPIINPKEYLKNDEGF